MPDRKYLRSDRIWSNLDYLVPKQNEKVVENVETQKMQMNDMWIGASS